MATEIVLTDEQVRQVLGATDVVEFCDLDGNVLARAPLVFSKEEAAIVAEAKRRLAGDSPRYPSADVRRRLA